MHGDRREEEEEESYGMGGIIVTSNLSHKLLNFDISSSKCCTFCTSRISINNLFVLNTFEEDEDSDLIPLVEYDLRRW